MKVRTHYSITLDVRTACGVIPSAVTNVEAEVTCRLCSRALERVAAEAAERRDRRGDAAPAVLTGPGQSELGAEGERAIARSIAGEPIYTGARWGSVSSAMAALAMTQDARRSVASSSSPDRFGRGMGGGDGGLTPTTPRETREDTIDLERALSRACGPVRVGTEDVGGPMVRAIAEARLLGRRVVQPVTEKDCHGKVIDRKSTTIARFEVSAVETAEHAGMTRSQIGIVVRTVRRRLAEELGRKGLIPARAVARESEDKVDVIGYDLSGWKAISAFVGKSETWCRERAGRDEEPLPVARLDREVYARKEEVTAWLKRKMRAA